MLGEVEPAPADEAKQEAMDIEAVKVGMAFYNNNNNNNNINSNNSYHFDSNILTEL